jgi:hypothetical protein
VKRTYAELIRHPTLEDRFRYLSLKGRVGHVTFGSERYMNQRFYQSVQWRNVRDYVIMRDNGCDLGVEGWEIHRGLYIHHMNPMTPESIREGDPSILDPDNLITCSMRTHQAIHYGDERQLARPFVERSSGDTTLWRR